MAGLLNISFDGVAFIIYGMFVKSYLNIFWFRYSSLAVVFTNCALNLCHNVIKIITVSFINSFC